MTSRPHARRRSTGVELPPFQRFLDEHREAVYRFLVASAGPGEAEDCFQETFLAALRSYPRLRDGSNLRGLVMTIAHRKALDAHRGSRRRPDPVAEVPERAAAATEPADPVLWKEVRALPDGQRGAVLLRFVADLAYADIAASLGCSVEAARQRVREGLKNLKERIR